jgi:pimeloyl-ACP methyl ester carboxylesterase
MKHRPDRTTLTTAILLAATLLASCGDSSSSNDEQPVPIWDGVGDFFDVPDPLPAGEPGELIRVQQIDRPNEPDRVTLRVMYHTRDARDRDVAATGTIAYPLAEAPEGGWPVVSYGHGTSGLAPKCAPSRSNWSPPSFGIQGVMVAADYPGLGPNGQRHSYLSGRSEGQSVIDIVRAARRIPDAGAGKRWAAVGESQGGHAVLFADELADSYASELELVGTVPVAPGAELPSTFPGDTEQVIGIVTVLGLFGMAEDYPEIDPADYASPELLAASPILDTECLDEVSLALAVIPYEDLFIADPRRTEPALSVLIENDPARRATSAPLLLVQGTADPVVVPARTDALLERLCGLGADVELVTIPGAAHDVLRHVGTTVVGPWLESRFSGGPTASSCDGGGRQA